MEVCEHPGDLEPIFHQLHYSWSMWTARTPIVALQGVWRPWPQHRAEGRTLAV